MTPENTSYAKKVYTVLGRCPLGTGKIAEALAKSVPNMLPLVRNRVSHFAKKGKDGQPIPDYADLAQCHKAASKALAAQDLVVVQVITNDSEGDMILCTQLLHSSGEYIESFMPIKGGTSPQQTAAAITYARRTAYCAMVGLAADDDDNGVEAEVAAASEDLEGSARIAALATKALQAAGTPDDRAEVLAKAELRTKEGKLSVAALQELKSLAAAIDQQQAGRKKKEPVHA